MGRFSLASSPETLDDDDHDEHQLTPFARPLADGNDTLVHPQESYMNTTPSIYIYHSSHVDDKSRRIPLWWMALGALIVAHLVARFGPPAPPPSDDEHIFDWHDFFRIQGTRLYQSITALIYVIPHVWKVCTQNIRQEVSHAWHEWTRLPACPLLEASNTTTTMDLLNISGQAQATTVVVDALHAWNHQSCLILLFSGTVGTGKAELARQMAQLVSSSSFVGEKCTNGVLELDALQNQQHDLLVHSVMMHAVRHGTHGALVILRHFDSMSTRHVVQILKSLQHYDKLIFVGITGIGARAIHQHLKQYKDLKQIPKLQLEMDMRDEVDDHFDEPVEQYIHVMVPFAPIGQAELQEILQHFIRKTSRQQQGIRWKSLVITSKLTAALVGPSNVEYMEWKDKTTEETVLVFSATGAHVLEDGGPIMNKVTLQIKQCLTDIAPDRIGKLDFDESIGQGVVSWCVGTACFEACRFSI